MIRSGSGRGLSPEIGVPISGKIDLYLLKYETASRIEITFPPGFPSLPGNQLKALEFLASLLWFEDA